MPPQQEYPPQQENNWELCSRDYAQAGSMTGDAGVSGYPVTNVNDGDRGTFYRKAAVPGVLTLDLGATRTIDRVMVRCPKFYGVQTVVFESSTNGSLWTLMAVTPYGTVQHSTYIFLPTALRYVRLTVSALPANVTELRIAQVCAFKSHYEFDGYKNLSSSSGMLKAMPFNPPPGRAIGFTGRVMVPLMHGTNFRVQQWGSERRTMTVGFPLVLRMFYELLEWYKDRGTAFGILDHEFDFWNVVIVPGGLRVNEVPSDGPGHADASPERIYPSESWYSVEADVQEVASSEAVTEEEPPGAVQEGEEEEIIMTDIVEVP